MSGWSNGPDKFTEHNRAAKTKSSALLSKMANKSKAVLEISL